MKIKKFIGQKVNGFWVVDTYPRITANGKKTRKVLLRCDDCGREFERQSGVDFEHIKCKCKCTSYPKKHFKKYKLNGKEYLLVDLRRIYGVSESTIGNRLKLGYSIEEAVTNKTKKICPICDKEFEDILSKKYCSKTCTARAGHHKGKYKKLMDKKCVVCGKEFKSIRDDAKTCSDECRNQLDRISRNRRYKKLKEKGSFDESVVLINVFNKFSGKCQCCNKELNFKGSHLEDDYPSIDHIIPLSKGGTHTWDNVQLLCRRCNYMKSDKT